MKNCTSIHRRTFTVCIGTDGEWISISIYYLDAATVGGVCSVLSAFIILSNLQFRGEAAFLLNFLFFTCGLE